MYVFVIMIHAEIIAKTQHTFKYQNSAKAPTSTHVITFNYMIFQVIIKS